MTSPVILATIADLEGERCLAAVAADSRLGARIAHINGVTGQHFTTAPYARVFDAAVDLVDEQPHADRLAALAHTAHVDAGWLAELVAGPRKCLFDTSGAYARRVLASAERVARYQTHIAGLLELGLRIEQAA